MTINYFMQLRLMTSTGLLSWLGANMVMWHPLVESTNSYSIQPQPVVNSRARLSQSDFLKTQTHTQQTAIKVASSSFVSSG